MMLHKSFRFVIIGTLLTACYSEAKPTRTECIVGYELDWADVKSDPVAIGHLFNWNRSDQRFSCISARVTSEDMSKVYFQLKCDCKNRIKISESLISEWKSIHGEFPEFDLINDKIEPSTKTIDVRGKYWSD